MDFISNQAPQILEMLSALGIERFEDLLKGIDPKLQIPRPTFDDGLSELEGGRLMEHLAAKNTFTHFDHYLGAGSYEHHIPAFVGAITSRSEFLTAYTPYQAEASQGMLQTIFEFQTALGRLTGLEVANASVYDATSACAEACTMALRHTKRHKILVAQTLHPHYLEGVKQYLGHLPCKVIQVPFQSEGLLDEEALDELLDEEVAAFLIQSPNFLGSIENVKRLFDKVHAQGAVAILCANPLSYGLYASAKELGADIAVGDCQPFGLPQNFGGAYAGYMTCSEALMRQMPGRIIGRTVDKKGRVGYVLTLQAREQHIRREKATSNICTNQALCALSSLLTLLWYGKEGVPKLALTNYQRATYLKRELEKLPQVQGLNLAPYLNEFTLKLNRPIKSVLQYFRMHGIEAGVDLSRFYPELTDHLLICVTETKNKDQLDHYLKTALEILG